MAGPRYKVLITTSGLGQRLGNLTKHTNKSLVRVGSKPSLSYIIESYKKNIPLIITIGHFADHIKEFVSLAYPDRKIEFVKVNKYQGKGSSLGYSMLAAKKKLQCPFIFHACDTVTVKEKIPAPTKNWIAYHQSRDTSQYSSLNTLGDNVLSINKKGATDSDKIHIGLVGIVDYKAFWDALTEGYNKDKNDSTLNDCVAINTMLRTEKTFSCFRLKTWLDIGNTTSLEHARSKLKDSYNVLDKEDESIFIFDKFVIKFFANQDIVTKRVKRAKILKDLVPKIEKHTKNFYRYEYSKGDLYSRVVQPTNFIEFLNWAHKNLWTKQQEVKNEDFQQKNCKKFYKDKTNERIKQLLEKTNIHDTEHTINGEKVPGITNLLSHVDFDQLCDTEQYRIHGDFILDNIIKTKKGYCLLDWRQDFGGLLKAGDMYYDLAKLNHNLTLNHDIVSKNLFDITIDKTNVTCDILRSENHVACQKVFHKFIQEQELDLNKIQILTSIIWLNMSPLHSHPLNLFLFYFGKLNLWRALQNQSSHISSSMSMAFSQQDNSSTQQKESLQKSSAHTMQTE